MSSAAYRPSPSDHINSVGASPFSDITIKQLLADNERLRAENESLRVQLRQAKRALQPARYFPFEWGLTQLETRILDYLYQQKAPVKPQRVLDAIYIPYGREPAYMSTVGVCIHRMRKKLSRFGIDIRTEFGFGYYLTPTSRDIIKDFINESK
jgi:DNA-binding response OmpR family regulator